MRWMVKCVGDAAVPIIDNVDVDEDNGDDGNHLNGLNG